VRLDRPHTTPSTDPYAALVYSARADDIIFTMCDGVALYDGGAWLTINAAEAIDDAVALRRSLETEPTS
jgi:5-methylthioadenosine/S-adenosylhomocysteine deaminase